MILTTRSSRELANPDRAALIVTAAGKPAAVKSARPASPNRCKKDRF